MKGIHAEFKCLHLLLFSAVAASVVCGGSDGGLAVRTERTFGAHRCHVVNVEIFKF